MEQVIIKETKYSPRVELNPEGKIIIQGRSLIEDPHAFYNPIVTWANNCSSQNMEVEISLEYLNTSSSKYLFSLLRGVQDNYSIKTANVKWFYDEDDEDGLELGKEFESQIKIPFTFFACSEAMA